MRPLMFVMVESMLNITCTASRVLWYEVTEDPFGKETQADHLEALLYWPVLS